VGDHLVPDSELPREIDGVAFVESGMEAESAVMATDLLPSASFAAQAR